MQVAPNALPRMSLHHDAATPNELCSRVRGPGPYVFGSVRYPHSYTQGRSEPVLARHCHCIVAPCLGYNAVSESTSTVLISLNGFRVRSHTHVLLSVSCGLSQQVAGSVLLGVDTDCPNPVKLRRLLGVDTEVVNKAADLSMVRCRHRLS